MIRLIQRKLIIPRGDTGSFSVPTIAAASQGDVAVFTIFDCLTRAKVFQKIVTPQDSNLVIEFTHNDTVNLPPGRYVWDIKFYKNPQYADDELVNGDEIDSYYAGYSLPDCEIRETGDNLLVSPDAAQGALSPEQLDIISAAIASLNDAIQKTEENVEHYPQIRDEEWYVWNAETGDYVDTGVSANGIIGNGIESTVLNADYTLTLNFTDGTSYTSPSIRGATGNGIDDIVLNNDYTLTIVYTDGNSYTTPSIRGPVGVTPHFSIGTVQEDATAAATITGTAENPILNLTLPNANVPTKVSELENDSHYAVDANYVHTDNNYTTEEKNKLSGIAAGAEVNVNADWNAVDGDAFIRNKPTLVSSFTNDAGYLTTETDPTVPSWAKATQKPTYTAAEVGATTEQEVSGMIANAIGQINSFDMAIVQTLPTQNISTHTIYLVPKTGEVNDVYDEYVYINNNWEMIGNTQIDLSGYALKSELPANVSELNNDSGYLTSYTETDPTVPAWAKAAQKPSYTASEVGALPSNTHIPSTTAELTNNAGFITVDEVPDVPVTDVQVNGVSVLNGGVANVPTTDATPQGLVPWNRLVGTGLYKDSYGYVRVSAATLTQMKAATSNVVFISAQIEHAAAFYGLAKAAGDTTQSQSNNAVGTYTPEASAAIRAMIGAENGDDIIKIQDTQPTTPATKIWLPETAPASVQVPTVSEMNTALAEKANLSDIPDIPVDDVQINGTSIVNNGIANVPIATSSDLGVVKVNATYGIGLNSARKDLELNVASSIHIKAGAATYNPLVPAKQHESVFYGLAKAAGDTTQSASSNAVGTYTDSAKNAIHSMLGTADLIEVGFVEEVTGTTPSITGKANYRYNCGEVSTLSITPPAAGSIDVFFQSGSTATVLTVPSTVKWPAWFDATALETDTTYELLITDGTYGSVMTWAT